MQNHKPFVTDSPCISFGHLGFPCSRQRPNPPHLDAHSANVTSTHVGWQKAEHIKFELSQHLHQHAYIVFRFE
jgi:hypothetical protein